MGMLRGFRRLDAAVLGEVPSTPEARLSFLRRYATRGQAAGFGPGLIAAAVVDMSERLDQLEQRVANLERNGER